MQVFIEKPHVMAESRGTRDVSSFSGIFSSLSFANVWNNCLRHFLLDRERHPLLPRKCWVRHWHALHFHTWSTDFCMWKRPHNPQVFLSCVTVHLRVEGIICLQLISDTSTPDQRQSFGINESNRLHYEGGGLLHCLIQWENLRQHTCNYTGWPLWKLQVRISRTQQKPSWQLSLQ